MRLASRAAPICLGVPDCSGPEELTRLRPATACRRSSRDAGRRAAYHHRVSDQTPATSSTYELDPTLLEGVDLSGLPGTTEVLLVPDRISVRENQRYAGFRPDTQELRMFLKAEGLRVDLLVPPGTKTARYLEHDNAWVIPLAVAVGTLSTAVGNLMSESIKGWVRERLNEGREADHDEPLALRYRVAELDPISGKIIVRELSGSAEAVIKALERGGEPDDVPPS
jgi:hypothetical protein